MNIYCCSRNIFELKLHKVCFTEIQRKQVCVKPFVNFFKHRT